MHCSHGHRLVNKIDAVFECADRRYTQYRYILFFIIGGLLLSTGLAIILGCLWRVDYPYFLQGVFCPIVFLLWWLEAAAIKARCTVHHLPLHNKTLLGRG